MKSPAHAALLAALALTLPGCRSTQPTGPVQPAFLAYWQASSALPRCPPSEEYECVSIEEGKKNFLNLLKKQRGNGLKIVRFDAFIDRSNKIYAAAWEKSELEHEFEMEMDWKEFSRAHLKNTKKGYRLIHLRVYPDGRRQRVAAIWSEPSASDAEVPPAKVVFHQSFYHLKEVQKVLQKQGYYLAAFDVYPQLNDPERHFIVGVFQHGAVEADWARTPHSNCLIHDPILVVQADESDPHPPVCSLDSDADEFEDVCPFAEELQQRWNEGYRPAGFESYWEDGVGQFLVLLHRRETPADWLMVPAVKDAVNCRHKRLNPSLSSDRLGTGPFLGFNLVDLDLHLDTDHIQSELRGSSGDQIRLFPDVEFPTHMGLVHDDGTSGPPGG